MKDDVMISIITSPGSRNSNNSFIKDKKNDDEEKVIAITVGKNKTMGDKYKQKLAKQAAKNPNSVKVKTPEGWMTVKEAIEAGFDPKTGEFTGDIPEKPSIDKYFPNKSKRKKDRMKERLDPKAVNASSEDMRRIGGRLQPGEDIDPRIKPGQEPVPVEGAPIPGEQPIPQPGGGQPSQQEMIQQILSKGGPS